MSSTFGRDRRRTRTARARAFAVTFASARTIALAFASTADSRLLDASQRLPHQRRICSRSSDSACRTFGRGLAASLSPVAPVALAALLVSTPVTLVAQGAQRARAAPTAQTARIPPTSAVQTRERAAPQAHALDRPRVYEGPPLALAEAQAEAIAAYPELRALAAEVEAAGHRAPQERALPAPTFEAQIWQWPIDRLDPRDAGMYMLSASQEVPGRGKRDLREQAARRAAEAMGAELETRRQEVRQEVAAAYAELVLVRAEIEAHVEDVALLRAIADAAAITYATGGVAQSDPLRAAAEVTSLHDTVLALDERALIVTAQLNTLMHRPPRASIGPLTPSVERTLTMSEEAMEARAIARHPRADAAHRREAQAEAEQRAIAADRRPDFMVMGGYMLTPSGRDAWMGSIGVTWPSAPWARGRLDARNAEAAARLDAARAGESAALTRIQGALADAQARAETASRRAALLRSTLLPQTVDAVEAARVAYEARRGALATVFEAQRLRLDTRLRHARALRDLDRALADLSFALGGAPLDAFTRTSASIHTSEEK